MVKELWFWIESFDQKFWSNAQNDDFDFWNSSNYCSVLHRTARSSVKIALFIICLLNGNQSSFLLTAFF